MVDVADPTLSVRRQGKLLEISRSSIYYQVVPESALNLHLMRLIDEQFMRTPFYGWRKMGAYLRRLGYAVNGKRVRRLMRLMGIQAIYPRRNSSSAGQGHKRYPYLTCPPNTWTHLMKMLVLWFCLGPCITKTKQV